MANKRISQLPAAASPLAGDTLLPVELTAGDTKRATLQQLRSFVSIQDYGADPTGATANCTAALQAAIAAGAASIYFPKGSYRVSANADITLVNDVTLWGEGVIQYVGAGLADVLWRFICNGYSLTVNGLTFDGATAAAGGILIRNTTAMTTSLPDATVQECTFRNFKMLAVCDKSVGASVAGSFNTVYVLNNRVQNITRAAGTGVISVSGTSGINITTVNLGGGALRWPRQCIHTGNSYDNISGDDAAGSAANYDYDGFVFAVPSPASFSNSDSSQNVFTPAELISSGNSYRNCRGRALKVQGIPTITNEKIVRDAGYCLTTGSVEIDMQFGVGTVKNCTFMYYDYLVGATVTSPLSGGLALLSGYQGSSLGEATTGLVIDGITVFNEIKSGIANSTIDIILYATIGHSTPLDRQLVSLSNVIVNRNPVTAILQSDFNAGQYGLISLENVTVPSLAQAAVLIASTNTDRRINAVNVVNLAGVKNSANAVPFFRQAGTFADGTWQGVVSGYNNLGFLFSYRNSSSELRQTPSLVDAALVGKERQGALSVQTVELADEETKAFDTRGIVTNRGLIGISVSWGTGSQGILSCSDNQVYVIAARATNDFEASTTGTNPDVAGKINLWYTGGRLNVKNRLGSSRFVTIWFLG